MSRPRYGLPIASEDAMMRYQADESARVAGIQARTAQAEEDRLLARERLAQEKLKDESQLKWEREKFSTGRTPNEMEKAAMGITAASAPLELTAKQIAIDKANEELRQMKGGIGQYEFAKRVPADVAEEMLFHLGKYVDVTALTPRQTDAALNMMNSGKKYGQIAPLLGKTIKPKATHWMSPDEPDTEAENMTWQVASGITPETGVSPKPASIQPPPQPPAESPEIANARFIVSEFKKYAASNPQWRSTVSRETGERVSKAKRLLDSIDKPKAAPEPIGVTPQAPRGQIVPNEQLQDLNGDGKRDDADKAIDDQYSGALDRIARFDAKVKASPGVVIPPSVLAQIDKQRQIVKAYQSVYRKQAAAHIGSVKGIGQ